tara:strand:+ start:835 stop:969 length:135 start_codon:yes stop_codon:yes gene_type:complete
MSKQAVVTILKKPSISVWARNHWNGVLRELKRKQQLKKMGVKAK